MRFFHGQAVTVHRQTTDRYGDPIEGDALIIRGCAVAPRSSDERQDNRNTVITGLTLYGPTGVDIRASDVVELGDGTRWTVLGEVGRWASPFTGWSPGVEVALERVTG